MKLTIEIELDDLNYNRYPEEVADIIADCLHGELPNHDMVVEHLHIHKESEA